MEECWASLRLVCVFPPLVQIVRCLLGSVAEQGGSLSVVRPSVLVGGELVASVLSDGLPARQQGEPPQSMDR